MIVNLLLIFFPFQEYCVRELACSRSDIPSYRLTKISRAMFVSMANSEKPTRKM